MAVILGVVPVGTRISINPMMLIQERVLTGASFGSSRQRVDLPMLVDLYMDGKIKLNELISRRLPLEDINRAFELLKAGEVARSVIMFD
jgi:S-(hydroxymethyl)glutathione dehydrogenase/alcohol dehydrogenase